MSNIGLKSVLALKTVYSFWFNTFQYVIDNFLFPSDIDFIWVALERILQDIQLHPMYLFPNSDVLDLKTMLQVDLLHSSRSTARSTASVQWSEIWPLVGSTARSTDRPFWPVFEL